MIIAFTGEKKSGKDFFCEFLEQKLNATRLSFSDEVRRLATQLYPWLPFDFDPAVKDSPYPHPCNPNNLSPRQIWLTVGKVRDVDPHFFVRRFSDNQWPAIDSHNRTYIITDLRTEEEYMFLKEHNVPIIKIKVDDRTGIQEDSFEDWVREFIRYDALFINAMNGTDDFEKFFTEFVTRKF